MSFPIDFYFDFASPYGYLASHQIDRIAKKHKRAVTWRPIMLGVAFRVTGAQPATTVPLRGDYVRMDVPRYARLLGLPFTLPANFPMMALAPSRAFYWLNDRDPAQAKALAKGIFDAYYGEGRDMSRVEAVAEVAAGVGVDPDVLIAAAQDQAIKDKLKDETEKAIALGVFGSPFVVVDGEQFWGADRLWQVDDWLKSGGW